MSGTGVMSAQADDAASMKCLRRNEGCRDHSVSAVKRTGLHGIPSAWRALPFLRLLPQTYGNYLSWLIRDRVHRLDADNLCYSGGDSYSRLETMEACGDVGSLPQPGLYSIGDDAGEAGVFCRPRKPGGCCML